MKITMTHKKLLIRVSKGLLLDSASYGWKSSNHSKLLIWSVKKRLRIVGRPALIRKTSSLNRLMKMVKLCEQATPSRALLEHQPLIPVSVLPIYPKNNPPIKKAIKNSHQNLIE